ncbi:MAG: anthranilate synthase component 1 [Xanthomonadaceae bacterium]|nr:anthranilate synthase component 1 [Xanthomonadaceae bacterium]
MNTEVLRLRIDRCPPPTAAYMALCDNGRRPGTALLESAARGHGGTRRSLIAVAPALRIALHGDRVTLTAASANGRTALARLADAGVPSEIPVPQRAGKVTDESARLREPSVLDPLRQVLAALAPARTTDRDALLLVGALAFELADRFDALPPLPAGPTPDFVFTVPELVLDIDHLSGRAELRAIAFDTPGRRDLARALEKIAEALEQVDTNAPAPPDAPAQVAAEECDDAAFALKVKRAQAAVVAGTVYQLVVSRSWTMPCTDPFAAYRRLRAQNPSPYLFYLCDESGTLFGASPESALRFDAVSRTADLYPVAGTRARGSDDDGDARVEAELRHDPKELAEHMMLVDLARNDIARICEPGTRTVPVLLGVDRYRHVMHLVSRVQGRLRADLDAFHALRACLNMGTLSGAPKLSASALIRELEGVRRGFYGGAVGVLDAAGNLDTAITIRAAFVRDGEARVQAGAGIVLDSHPQREADETRAKAQAVLDALGGAPA